MRCPTAADAFMMAEPSNVGGDDGNCVYAGHAGTDVAIYSSRFLHKNVVGCETFKKKDFESALKEGFLKTDADLRLESGMVECQRIRREVARSKQHGSDEEDEVKNPVIHCHVVVVYEKVKTA